MDIQDPSDLAHIEEGYRQAERGEVIDGDQARAELQQMKQNWRRARDTEGIER